MSGKLLIQKLRLQIKNLEGWNKEMYSNHKLEVEGLNSKLKEYEYLGERISAQDGMWLNLHAGAMEWLLGEFERLRGEK